MIAIADLFVKVLILDILAEVPEENFIYSLYARPAQPRGMRKSIDL